MNEQIERKASPVKHTCRTRMWWKCWDMHKFSWRNNRVQESFITIYSMKWRKPFYCIPAGVFREILTYVDFLECHRLKMHKEYLLWWNNFWNQDSCSWEREGMQRAFIEIHTVKYRAPFCRIHTFIFRKILTYCLPEENAQADN